VHLHPRSVRGAFALARARIHVDAQADSRHRMFNSRCAGEGIGAACVYACVRASGYTGEKRERERERERKGGKDRARARERRVAIDGTGWRVC